MTDAITIKALQDASLDAKSLEEVVNGDENVVVTSRLGETYPSIKSVIENAKSRLFGAIIGFSTKADMDASREYPAGTLALVTNDPTPENNGAYRKTGASGSGIWVQSVDRVSSMERRTAGLEHFVGGSEAAAAWPLTNQITNGNFAVESSTAGVPAEFLMTKDLLARATPSLIPQPDGSAIMRLSRNDDGTSGAISIGKVRASTTGHVYYSCALARCASAQKVNIQFFFGGGQNVEHVGLSDEWSLVSAIRRTSAGAGTANLGFEGMVPGDYVEFTAYMRFDLTETYGAGNEPGIDEMDRLIRGLGYFDGAGRLSNTARATRALLAGEPRQHEIDARHRAGVFRLATFNTGGVTSRPYSVREVISRSVPDVLVCQEAYSNNDPDSTRRPTLIYQTWPLIDHRFHVTSPSTGWDRGWLTASSTPIQTVEWYPNPVQGVLRTVHLLNGRRVAVWNIHLPASGTADAMRGFVQSLADVVALDPERYVIVAGDFNTPTTKHLDPITPWTIEPLAALGYTNLLESLDWPATYKITTDPTTGSIDNIFIPRGMEFIDSGIIDSTHANDHALVWADIRFTGNDGDLYSPDGSRWQQEISDAGVATWVKF